MQPLSVWHIQIYAGCVIGALAYSWIIFKRTSLIGGLLLFYTLLLSIHAHFKPYMLIDFLGPVMGQMLTALAAASFMWVFCLTFPFLLLEKKHFYYVTWIFVIFGILDSIAIIFKLGVDQFKNSGFLLNPAQDGTFIACLLPFAYYTNKRVKWPIMALFITAIIMSEASTPLVGLGIFLACALWFSKYRKFLLLGPAAVFGLGVLLQGYHQVTSSSGRLNYIWPLVMKFWAERVNILTGSGPGSFYVYGPGIELAHHGFNYRGAVYIWLHNEWLQILFELGIIGLLLTLLFFALSLKKAYNKPHLFSLLLIYGVTAAFQMPMRQFLSAFLLIYIIRLIYEEKNLSVPQS